MKKKIIALATTFAFIASLSAVVLTTTTVFANGNEWTNQTDLIAGQNKDVGNVLVDYDGTNLYVKYDVTESEWCLTETHLDVVTDPADFPTNRGGNPKVGQFEHKKEHNCVDSYIYEVPLSDWSVDEPLYIAAHAVVAQTVVGDWECADFSELSEGDSVEGLGTVAPNLNIDTPTDGAVKIVEGGSYGAYGAPNGDGSIINGGICDECGGFSDLTAKSKKNPHSYTFTFADGMTVHDFSLHMLDFGDYNPSRATSHAANMTAYNSDDTEVDEEILKYTSNGGVNPSGSPDYGDLWYTGDAVDAEPGEPGNWTWNVSGSGIAKVKLNFSSGHDPNIGFDSLCFRAEEEVTETAWGEGIGFAGNNWAMYFTVKQELVDTVEVQADNPNSVSSNISLVDGEDYKLEALGTAEAGDTIEFDAEYSITNRISEDTWTDLVSGYTGEGEGLLELMVDGNFIEWGDYTSDHTYYHTMTGDGDPVELKIHDIYYLNNEGSLTVNIYELP